MFLPLLLLTAASTARGDNNVEFCASLEEALLCPVTNLLMREPYTLRDGHSYDLDTLRAWLERGHVSSPLTGKPLGSLDIVPYTALSATIKVNHHKPTYQSYHG